MDAISSLMLQEGWRKGPWTALEDRLLTEYVQQHGEGSWNSVAKLTGMCCTSGADAWQVCLGDRVCVRRRRTLLLSADDRPWHAQACGGAGRAAGCGG